MGAKQNFILKKECKLQGSENEVLRKIPGSRKDEASGDSEYYMSNFVICTGHLN
jgi:hypothetical protein